MPSAEFICHEACHTPACWSGPDDPRRKEGKNGLSELFLIGRRILSVCQNCGRHRAVSERQVNELLAAGPDALNL